MDKRLAAAVLLIAALTASTALPGQALRTAGAAGKAGTAGIPKTPQADTSVKAASAGSPATGEVRIAAADGGSGENAADAASVTESGAAAPVQPEAAEKNAEAEASVLELASDPQLDPVSLPGGGTVALKRAFLSETGEGNTAWLTLTVHNGGSRELKFTDYWIRLTNRDGDEFTVKLIGPDEKKFSVAPKGDLDFTFFAPVGEGTGLQDLVVTVFEWDFSAPRFEKDLGSIVLPDDYSSATPAKTARIVEMGGQPVKTYADRLLVLKGAKDQLATAVFHLENTGTRKISVPAYRFTLKTADGSSYSLGVDGLGGLQIQPKDTRTVVVSGNLPMAADLAGCRLTVTLNDSDNGFDYPVAEFVLPEAAAADQVKTPAGQTFMADMEGFTMKTWVDKVTRSKYTAQQKIGMAYHLENESNQTAKLSGYGFMLLTKDGSTYPLAADDMKELDVQAKEEKEIALSAEIPSSVDLEDTMLVVYKTHADGNDPNLIFPVGWYGVGFTQGQAVTGTAEIRTADGIYKARVESLQRLPWMDKDQMAVELSLANDGDTSLPVPKLGAYFQLDDAAKLNARVIRTDELALLEAHSSMTVTVVTDVAYRAPFQRARLVLQETNDSGTNDLCEFALPPERDLTALPVVGPGLVHSFAAGTQSADLRIHGIRSYNSDSSSKDLYYVELEVENTGSRFGNLAKWAGFFRTKDGQLYPAIVSDYKESVAPGGKVLLAFWSQLPKGRTWADLQLLVGQGITGSQLTPLDKEPDGLIRPVLFNVPGEGEPKKDYTDLSITPYLLSLSNISTSLSNSTQVRFAFDYDLRKDTSIDAASLGDHRLVVEFKSRQMDFTEKLDLEKGSDDNVLNLGKGTYEYTKKLPSGFYQSYMDGEYKLNLYDEFQGQRRLLFSKDFDWMTNME
jgi:hypothetical protein